MKNLVLAMVLLVGVAGCSSENLETWRGATTQAIEDTRKGISDLPANDPSRIKGEKILAEAEKVLAQVNAAIEAAQTGNLNTPVLRDALSGIPYGPLILAIAGAGYGVWRRLREAELAKAAKQIVNSVDEAFPAKTDEQKLKLASVQDEATRALVADLRK